MRSLVTGEQMKAIDRYTIEEIGIPSLVLQERAACCVADEVRKRVQKGAFVWAACGTGNNGADAIAAARMLFLDGYYVTVILCGNRERETEECRLQRSIAEKLGIPVTEWTDFIPGRCQVLIDGVFGVGLARNVEGDYRRFLEMLKGQEKELTVAVDMPSGIHSDTGRMMGIALKADVTVTFGWEKRGTVLYPGRDFAGTVVIGDIGFPQISFQKAVEQSGESKQTAFSYGPEDLNLIPKRPAYSNKGTFGHVLIVAGSVNMSGAAYLSAKAAYRCGAGLVKILTPEANRQILQSQIPEAIISTYEIEAVEEEPERFGRFLEEQCVWADAVVLGPGLGTEPYVRNLVPAVLSAACSAIILDADGLNTIAANPEMTRFYTDSVIITPHMGEMARLTGQTIKDLQENIAEAASGYARRYGITCVLKDAATAAADREGRLFLNTSGNSAMAKAGSGDVLTGAIAALCAQGMEPAEGAFLGVYLHGLAGDLLRREGGAYGLLAGELADALGRVMRQEE